jgi:beta-fructofuranosidase
MMSKSMNTYGPKDKLLWDSWFFEREGAVHAFYLQARPSTNPDEKHERWVTIGHAVSNNFRDWSECATALEPGSGKAWDSLALWTGSVIEKDRKYYMFYTGRNSDPGKMWIQKIGLAVSNDLDRWKKSRRNPILKADKPYYMDNNLNALGKIGAWRDPFVFFDPHHESYFMTISARLKGLKTEYNGCVALAESKNLIDWKLQAPIFAPGVYDEIECTQMIRNRGFWYLFFSTHAKAYEPGFAKKIGGAYGGLHCYYADHIFGPYWPVNENGVVLANEKKMYDIRLIPDKGDDFNALGWLKTGNGKYSGRFTPPFKLRIEGSRVFAPVPPASTAV